MDFVVLSNVEKERLFFIEIFTIFRITEWIMLARRVWGNIEKINLLAILSP